jgi:hypothetical protein
MSDVTKVTKFGSQNQISIPNPKTEQSLREINAVLIWSLFSLFNTFGKVVECMGTIHLFRDMQWSKIE